MGGLSFDSRHLCALRGLLHREKKVLRERPFGVSPLPGAAISCAFAHLGDFLRIIFVRTFRPNRFAFAQNEIESRFAKRDALPCC